MKKILFLLSIFLLFSSNVYADTDIDYVIGINYSNELNQDANQVKGYNYLPTTENYDETSSFKITTKDKIAYCSDARLGNPGLSSGVVEWDYNCKILTGEKGKILTYIYEYGYGSYKTNYSSTDYLTGDYKGDYFLTQVAVWYHTIPSGWINNLNPSTGTYLGESNDFTKKLSKLINDAQIAGSEEASLSANISSSTMSLSGNYYVSESIKLSGKYLNSKITVSVSGVDGAFVTSDKNATSGGTTFENNSTVYIKVPKENIAGTTSKITLTATATSALGGGEIIECGFGEDATIQNIIEYNPKNINLSKSISVTASKLPVKISKQNITGSNEIAGAKLSIKRGNATIKTWTSTTEEVTQYLDPGTYTLEETVAPEGYIKSTSKVEFTVDSSGKVYVDGKEVNKVIMTNEPIMVSISKRDATGTEELPGAKLKVTDKDGNTVKDIEGNLLEWTSTKEAQKFHLAAGEYILSETIAPEGYAKSTNEIKFTVDELGKVTVNGKEVTEVIMVNKLITIKISKRSITGTEELEGATLRITDKNGNIAKDINGKSLEWISSKESKEFNLAAGTYILSETIAPEGYELSETTIEFTVTDAGKILIDGKEVENNLIIFKNTPEPEQVPTGNVITYIAITLGIISLGAVIFLIMKKNKR